MRIVRFAAASLIFAFVAAFPAFAQTFQLRGVDFTPSIYLEDSELQEAVAPYLNRPIRVSDVREMTDRVQSLYTRAGILTARVMLLPQTVDDGILELTLVEATIDRLTYSNLESTDGTFLRNNLSLRPGEAPDYDRLERDLRTFEIMFDFVPQLEFGVGSEFGTVSATVTGDPPETNTWVASVDNYGSENTGELRATLQGRLPNLTGVRDSALLQLQVSEGSFSIDGTYLRPIGGGGGVGYVAADYSTAEIVAGDFGVLGLESESYGLTLGYRRPFWIGPVSHWMVDVFATKEFSSSQFTALRFQEHDITEFGVQVSYQYVDNGRSWSASLGLKAGDAQTLQTSGTEGSYSLIYGTAGHARTLGENYLLDMSLAFQIAPDENLASPRLFSAGGPTTVRGYPIDVRAGDSGAVLRTQVSRWRPYKVEQWGVEWNPFGFVDLGVVTPFREDGFEIDYERDALASIGGGIRATFGKNIAGIAFVSVPMQETEGFDDTGSPVFSFGFDYTF